MLFLLFFLTILYPVYLTHTNRVETAQTFHGSFDRMTALTDAATFKCIKCNYYILCTPNFCA